MRRDRAWAPILLCAVALLSCSRPTTPSARVDAQGRRALPTDFALGFAPFEATFDDRVRLIGARLPSEVARGDRVEGELLWLVLKDCAGLEPKAFVHVTADGAELNLAQADHDLLGGAISPTEWRPGDVLFDRTSFVVPPALAVDELSVRVGLYEGKSRWPVAPVAAHDGADRVEVTRLKVTGAPPLARRAEVHRRTQPIAIDGVLDEPDWRRATPLSLSAHDGRTTLTLPTSARLLWDDSALFIAFVATDPDPFTPYPKRDDPLYESEAYEIFIDADGDQDAYVELQSAINDVHFDAAFSGGRRKNMERAYDVAFETKTRIDGDVVTQEWRIPIAELRDVPAGEPRTGASWRINLFRLERVRDQGRARVIKHEASAWSPPLSGDFHNLARLGTITFIE